MSIRKRPTKDPKVFSYQVVLRLAGNKTLSETYSNRKDAEFRESALKVAARLSTTPIPNKNSYKRVLLQDAVQAFIDSRPTGSNDRSVAKVVLNHCTGISLGAITKSYVKDYIKRMKSTNTERGTPYVWSSIHKQINVMRKAVTIQAERFNLEPPLSVLRYEMEEDDEDNSRNRVLSSEEESTLRNVLAKAKRNSEIWDLLITVAIETGARVGEIARIAPSQLNEEVNVLHIPKPHAKSKKDRHVPLSKLAQKTFKRLLELFNMKNLKNPGTVDRLFFQFSSAESMSQVFRKKVKKAGIVDFTFHDLRHTAITRMVLHKRELRISDIMVFTGHESLKMQRRYSNIRADELVQYIK
jgi:integrase